MMRLLLTVCVAALFACSQTLAGCRPSVLAEMLGAKAAKVEAIEQAKAEITVVVPADAEVFFDGDATTQKGTERLFFTPPLEVGKKYHYEILARWKQGGKTVEQTRKVPLTGGSRIRVDFSLEKPGTDPDKSPVVKPGQRMAVAKCVTENGLLVRRESPDKPWHIVENKEELYSSDLLVGGAASATDSLGGDIRLTFQGDLDGNSPFPIIETAVILHESKDVDLDFTLDRGRVDVENRKAKGQARVRVRLHGKSGEFTLMEPGARVALEVYGRWPKGVRFTKDANANASPALACVALAIKGEIELKTQAAHYLLKAPPGPALLMADDLSGSGSNSRLHLDELPAWATSKGDTDRAKKIKANLVRFRELVAKQPIGEVLDQMLNSDDESLRRSAVNIMGALDDLPHLGKALGSTKYSDVWENGVLALRHWIGRGPGQDLKLYKGMIDSGKFTPAQASIAMNLLHSFGDDDLAHPETYEALIKYLDNDNQAIRGLAYWHLSRLVPDGKKIGFNPMASKEERTKAVKEWQTLIPEGKMPPKPEAKDK